MRCRRPREQISSARVCSTQRIANESCATRLLPTLFPIVDAASQFLLPFLLSCIWEMARSIGRIFSIKRIPIRRLALTRVQPTNYTVYEAPTYAWLQTHCDPHATQIARNKSIRSLRFEQPATAAIRLTTSSF